MTGIAGKLPDGRKENRFLDGFGQMGIAARFLAFCCVFPQGIGDQRDHRRSVSALLLFPTTDAEMGTLVAGVTLLPVA
ncbi:MAG: hypothetical protein PHF23_09915 [Smithellaceae bacterium]|nr:hypothetical protein [Smithellaceae bacterium]